MEISLKNKFKLLHLTTHILTLFGFVWLFVSKQYHWLLIGGLCFLYVGIFGVNISLHRYFSHKSFKTGRVGYWLLLVSSILPGLGSPAAWGSVHLFHHAHSDDTMDPHNPNNVGALRSWFTVWPTIELPISFMRSFSKDRNVTFLHQNYFRIIYAYAAILFLIDWRLLVFVFALPAVGCFHGAAAIAVIPHKNRFFNYRRHATTDHSYNSWLACVLSLGEGWHNNHHHNPKKFQQGEAWWEIDPPAFFIKYFLRTKS